MIEEMKALIWQSNKAGELDEMIKRYENVVAVVQHHDAEGEEEQETA